jgi:hypothetical protein
LRSPSGSTRCSSERERSGTIATIATTSVRYVINNFRKHGHVTFGMGAFDYHSSAQHFDGWIESLFTQFPEPEPWTETAPRTWLLAKGWKVHGLIRHQALAQSDQTATERAVQVKSMCGGRGAPGRADRRPSIAHESSVSFRSRTPRARHLRARHLRARHLRARAWRAERCVARAAADDAHRTCAFFVACLGREPARETGDPWCRCGVDDRGRRRGRRVDKRVREPSSRERRQQREVAIVVGFADLLIARRAV